MNLTIRRSDLKDLDLLEHIEQNAFPLFQQSSRRILKHSLKSEFQQAWIISISEGEKSIPAGSLILYLYEQSVRIFSIAVLPEYQGKGLGMKLINHAREIALRRNNRRISLEVSAENEQLVEWYKRAGFSVVKVLKDYYEEGKDGVRMAEELSAGVSKTRISNIIVVDNPAKWHLGVENLEVVSSKDYTSDTQQFSERRLRVFNLCNSYKYQSIGYYVSLLASAREHRAIPNVTTIRDFRDVSVIRSIADDIDEIIQKTLQKVTEEKLELNIYFGQTVDASYKLLGQKLYQLFETPLFRVHFVKGVRWDIKGIVPLSLNKIEGKDLNLIQQFAKKYFEAKRFQRSKFKNYKYYLAILINTDEKNPPSDKSALAKFEQAADDLGFYTEFITKDDYNRLYEFDALFIRETTDVNNYTYQFARKAYAEGLAVIDDPWSILRCSNKIYLNERLKNNHINTPQTRVLFRDNIKPNELRQFSYPVILKQPDSAFSLGVTKVQNEKEMEESLEKLFRKSDLVIAQEFLPSEFDWRIGILDNQPIFACKYFMAKGHWQIYNWKGKQKDQEGASATLALEDVPEKVLKTAKKAASLMGDGLYGVDLKTIGSKVYVIEVNDNPNIDRGIEDKVAGFALYKRIMQALLTRIEMARNIERFVSIEPD